MSGNMIGRVFNNRYQITERIGIGGMAEVYRAQDRVLGRMVAVKVMLPQYAADTEFTQRFRQEAASAANLSSPYIVNVYDWGQDDGTYSIVMEYVRGSDLKTAIKQRGDINQRKVAEIGAQVCQALSVAHKQDIIHRDIKPQNIMVQPDGNVKVMDFGIAHAKNTVQGQTSAVLGTAHYISPEQAQGKDLTNSSDIYSLGVVLYEAATGKLPFDGPDSVSVATKQVQEFPVPPTQINPNLDPSLEAIIMHALEKDPRNRFATVGDMKHALNDFLAGRAVVLPGTGVTEVANAEPYKANSTPLPYSDGTSVMPTLENSGGNGGGGAIPPYIPPHTVVAPKEEKSGKGRTAAIIMAVLAALALLAVAAWFFLGNAPKPAPEVHLIPDVAGKTVEVATQELTEAGYVVGSTEESYDDKVESGKVIRTDPAANTESEEGSSVTLFVSVGKEQVLVPDLSEKNADQIKQLLDAAGLKGKEENAENSDTVESGLLIRQEPAAGTSVDVGSTVSYVLSKGTSKVTVEDVYGRSEADARTTLTNQGFYVEVYHDNSADYAAGTVMAMNPGPGTQLNKGDTVSITISDGSMRHTVTAEIYADPMTPAANVALDSYEVEDGGTVGYYITVPENYYIVGVTDGAHDYGTANSGQIANIKQNITLVVSLGYNAPQPQPDPEPEPDPEPTPSSSDSSSSAAQ